MTEKRTFGWKRDLPDHRDLKYSIHPEMLSAKLIFPSRVDLRQAMSPVENQGHIGSCVAHATAGSLEFLELRGLKSKSTGAEIFPNGKFDPISRLFIYYNARSLDGSVSEDAGTTLRSSIKCINKWGICREVLWQYDVSKVFIPPPVSAYKESASHLVLKYMGLDNAQMVELKQCLFSQYPFMFGVGVYDSFMSEETSKSGLVSMPKTSERLLGGHALCCVGYDDAVHGGSFIVRNSWGTDWGMKGYCYIPYAYMTNPKLADDFWTIRG